MGGNALSSSGEDSDSSFICSGSEGIGKIVVTANASKEISLEWEIPNFSSLTEKSWSPAFRFSHYSWHFKIKPKGIGDSLTIVLMKPDQFEITLISTFSLKNVNGTQEYVQKEKMFFCKTSPECLVKCPPASELMTRKSELLPSDTLTVQCTLFKICTDCEDGELTVIRDTSDEVEVEWKIAKSSQYKSLIFISPNFCLSESRWYFLIHPLSAGVWVVNDDVCAGCHAMKRDTSLQSFRFSLITEDGTCKTLCNENLEFIYYPAGGYWDVIPKEVEKYKVSNGLTVHCHMKFVHPLNPPSDYLIQDLKELLIGGKGSNIILKVKDREFKAHKLILQLRLPDFFAEFQNEILTGLVVVKDCDPDTYSDFLHFIYTGYIEEFSTQKAVNLYETADKHQHRGLKEVCLTYMRNYRIDQCFCDVMSLAIIHNEAELHEVATQFFLKYGSQIISTNEWVSFLSRHTEAGNALIVKLLEKLNLREA